MELIHLGHVRSASLSIQTVINAFLTVVDAPSVNKALSSILHHHFFYLIDASHAPLDILYIAFSAFPLHVQNAWKHTESLCQARAMLAAPFTQTVDYAFLTTADAQNVMAVMD
jgi:hypothetical protein